MSEPSAFDRLLQRLGLRLKPLFDPEAEQRRAREKRLVQELERQGEMIDGLGRRLDRETAQAAEVRTELGSLRAAVGTMRDATTRHGRLLKRSPTAEEHRVQAERVTERLLQIALGDRPILVGPWTGEIGFELLYWIPFVRWAVAKFRIDPSRIVIVSRGGTRAWYDGIGGEYLDALDLASVDEFRERTSEIKKQRTVRAFDRELLRRARARLGYASVSVLHPGLMYLLFMPFWKLQAPFKRLLDFTKFAPLAPPAVSLPPGLPDEYIAVRFYFSSCFPDNAANRAFVASTVTGLAERAPVVELTPGFRVDEHDSAPMSGRHRIHRISPPKPSENLAVQTAIISRARAFVGTYGGFSYLAPMYGVNAMTFYSDSNYHVSHLTVAHHVFNLVGGGALSAIDIATVPLLSAALRFADHPTGDTA